MKNSERDSICRTTRKKVAVYQTVSATFARGVLVVNFWMKEALLEATLAQTEGDVPVGALIVRDGEIIAKGHNTREIRKTSLGHAEMMAIDLACQRLGSWRLDDCDMYVTLEPCSMCAGAIIHSRIRRLYFGAWDTEAGACGGRFDLFQMLPGVKTEVYGGIGEDECREVLQAYFRNIRK